MSTKVALGWTVKIAVNGDAHRGAPDPVTGYGGGMLAIGDVWCITDTGYTTNGGGGMLPLIKNFVTECCGSGVHNLWMDNNWGTAPLTPTDLADALVADGYPVDHLNETPQDFFDPNFHDVAFTNSDDVAGTWELTRDWLLAGNKGLFLTLGNSTVPVSDLFAYMGLGYHGAFSGGGLTINPTGDAIFDGVAAAGGIWTSARYPFTSAGAGTVGTSAIFNSYLATWWGSV